MSNYNYINESDYNFEIKELGSMTVELDYFKCDKGKCTILKGYAWNGCTIAPDFDSTLIPSMVHDSLYQYGKSLELKRIVADKMFRDKLKEFNFKLTNVYYIGVRLFGWLFY
jgi:hypothetical protein